MMKKYYRNRYHSLLKAITEQNKKREVDLEEIRAKEEKRKVKLKENLGLVNVQSKFMEEQKQAKEMIIEEVVVPQKPQKKEKAAKRGSSLAPLKSASSFNRTAKEGDPTESTLA